MGTVYRVGLVGCGRMGATIDDEVKDHPAASEWLPYSHAAAYQVVKDAQLVAVCDVDAEKVRKTQERYDVAAGYTDYREMITKEDLDIVSVATCPRSHCDIVVFAAQNGVKGIYCDKPLCCSMKEADLMQAACREHGVKFNYGTQRRYAGLYKRIRQLCDEGELGEIVAVVAYFGLGPAQWHHTHTADMLLFLAGDPAVDFVQATAVLSQDAWDGDTLTVDPDVPSAYVHFDNGVHGYMTAGTGYEFEVFGTKGTVRTMNNGTGVQMRIEKRFPQMYDPVPFPDYERRSPTVAAIEDLVRALQSGGETSGGIEIAARSQEIVLATVQSHIEGGKRISLPLQNRSLAVCRPEW